MNSGNASGDEARHGALADARNHALERNDAALFALLVLEGPTARATWQALRR